MTVGRRGVTLIETLVVLSLIALLAAVAVVNAPPPRSDAREEADRLAARLNAAYTSALASGLPIRLDVSPGGYVFMTYADGKWGAAPTALKLPARSFKGGVAASVTATDPAFLNIAERNKQKPDDGVRTAVIDALAADGVSVAFSDRAGRWLVTLDRLGAVKVARDDK